MKTIRCLSCGQIVPDTSRGNKRRCKPCAILNSNTVRNARNRQKRAEERAKKMLEKKTVNRPKIGPNHAVTHGVFEGLSPVIDPHDLPWNPHPKISEGKQVNYMS